MATAAEDLANSSENSNDAENAAAPENPAENQEANENSNGADSPYAELAQKMGWVPKDQYQGDPETWKPADQFILDGRDIQRETSRELKTVRAQLDTIAQTSASIVEQQVKERVDELTAKYAKAVDDGDATEAFKLSTEIQSLRKSGSRQSAEAQAFADRNSSWFRKPGHEYATARAIAISNELQAAGYTDHGTQLQIVEQRLRKEMPELFGGQRNGKPAPQVNTPSGRSSGPGNRAKGFADLPPEAQKIAKDMEDRGVIKSKDDYAKNYFANLQAKG